MDTTSILTFLDKITHATFAWVLSFSVPSLILFFGSIWLLVAFLRANADDHSPIEWTDLLIDKHTNKVSLSKVGQFIGLIISSWAIIKLTSDNHLSFDLFGIYLAYCLGAPVLQTFIRGKYNLHDGVPPVTPPTPGSPDATDDSTEK